MPTVEDKKEHTSKVTIVKKLKDYSNEPAFKKKADSAVKFLRKNGLPKSLKKKSSK
jgi:hypothetical protein